MEPNPASHSRMVAPPGWLLDCPGAWLQQLPEALGTEAVFPLFQACRATRDLVLSEHHVRMGFPLPTENAAGQAHSLQLACQHAKGVRIRLYDAEEVQQPPELHQQIVGTSAKTLMLAAASQGLVSTVALEALDLDGVAPSWLASTCPNMTTLDLYNCSFNAAATFVIPVCTQLKELQLCGPPNLIQPADFVRWQQQLRALPGLEALTVDSDEGEDATPRFLEACSAIGPQLTRLRFSCRGFDLSDILMSAAWFPAVVDLCLNGTVVRDMGMEVLLGMHNLQKLQCEDFMLEEDYLNRPCAWTQLTMHTLDMGSFSLLPLGSVTSLNIDPRDQEGDRVTVYPSSNLQLVQQAVTTISERGGLNWDITDKVLLDNQPEASCACVTALMPIFSTAQQLRLFRLSGVEQVSVELLAAMRQHLTSPALTFIMLTSCTFAPDMWKQIIPSLPAQVDILGLHLETLTVDEEDNYMSEAQLTEMCVHAHRAVGVKVWGYEGTWEAGWKERVGVAMAAAGHQRVSFVEWDEEGQEEVGEGEVVVVDVAGLAAAQVVVEGPQAEEEG